MSRAVWLALGVGVGFAAAHKANETERGRALLQKADALITQFTDAVADGYHGTALRLPGLHSDPTAPHTSDPSPADPSRDIASDR